MGVPSPLRAVLLAVQMAMVVNPDVQRSSADVTMAALLACSAVVLGHFFEYSQRTMDASNAALREKLTQTLKAARLADSRLNHVLKNKSTEVCFLLRQTTELLECAACCICRPLTPLADSSAAAHARSAAAHARSAHSCAALPLALYLTPPPQWYGRPR